MAIDLPTEGGEEDLAGLVIDTGSITSSEEEMDEVLSRIDPDTGEDDEPQREEARAVIDEQLGGGEAASEGTEGEAEGETDEQPEDRGTAFEKAVSVLQRAKVPKAVIDSLSEADAMAWADDQAKSQATTDETYRRNAELERQLKGEDGSHEGESQSEEPPAGVDNPDRELEAFSEAFGEEASGALADYVGKRVGQSEQRASAMETMLENMIIENATASMRESFPQLDDADNVSKMVETATALVSTGTYSGEVVSAMKTAMKDAANQLWAEDNRTVTAAAKNQLQAKRRQGTSSVPHGSRTPDTSLSSDERDDRVLRALEEGASIGDARKAWG